MHQHYLARFRCMSRMSMERYMILQCSTKTSKIGGSPEARMRGRTGEPQKGGGSNARRERKISCSCGRSQLIGLWGWKRWGYALTAREKQLDGDEGRAIEGVRGRENIQSTVGVTLDERYKGIARYAGLVTKRSDLWIASNGGRSRCFVWCAQA